MNGAWRKWRDAAASIGIFHADQWAPKELVSSSMTELGIRLLKTNTWAILQGFRAIRDHICAWALWRLSPNVKIEWPEAWPPKVFLSCHHRRTVYEIDLCAQFIVPYDVKVITDRKYPLRIIKMLSAYLYNDTSINEMKSIERHWAIPKIMLDVPDGTAISTFPDRDGSQFYGDQGMTFRPGLFAASIYTGVPILDITIVEPTESCDCTHIVFTRWDPPIIDSQRCSSAEDYEIWRQVHKSDINAFTLWCEADFKKRVKFLEDQKATCARHEKVCADTTVDERYQRSMARNKTAAMYALK